MELMLELTRRCDMQCSHCLRGDAEGADMSAHVIRMSLIVFKDLYRLSIGGGEPTLKPVVINNLIQELSWSRVNFNYLEPTWMVTNGKRLLKQRDYYEEVDPYDEYEDDYEAPENTELAEVLVKFSRYVPLTLAVSTDNWHDKGAEGRFHHIKEVLDDGENITVVKHGPSSSNLISMGRNAGGGKDLSIEGESELYYVTVNGDVFASCDLSYSWMELFKGTPMHLGNVLTDSIETIQTAKRYLESVLDTNGGSVDVGHDDISEFLELEEEFHETYKLESA